VYDELMGGLKADKDKIRKANLKQNTQQERIPDRTPGQSRDQYGKRWNVNGRYARFEQIHSVMAYDQPAGVPTFAPAGLFFPADLIESEVVVNIKYVTPLG
jgi:hypothetical protein